MTRLRVRRERPGTRAKEAACAQRAFIRRLHRYLAQRPRARAHERAKAPPPPSRHRGSTSGAALMVELPSSVTSEGVDCPTHSGWPTLRSTSRNWHAWNGSRSPMMTVPVQTAHGVGRSAWEVSLGGQPHTPVRGGRDVRWSGGGTGGGGVLERTSRRTSAHGCPCTRICTTTSRPDEKHGPPEVRV